MKHYMVQFQLVILAGLFVTTAEHTLIVQPALVGLITGLGLAIVHELYKRARYSLHRWERAELRGSRGGDWMHGAALPVLVYAPQYAT